MEKARKNYEAEVEADSLGQQGILFEGVDPRPCTCLWNQEANAWAVGRCPHHRRQRREVAHDRKHA